MLPEDKEFRTSDLSYKPEDVNLTGVFSLGYFVAEQIFNLNERSKFRDIDSLEEKEKIAYFFKDKLKSPDDLKDYHLQSLSIRFVDDDELRKDVVPDITIYLVDGVELDFEKFNSKDLVIEMGLDWNAIIVLKDGISKERMSALSTDAIRADLLESQGYDTNIMEFIDMEHTPKNLLIRAVKRNGRSKWKAEHAREEVASLTQELQIEPTLQKLLFPVEEQPCKTIIKDK